MIRFIVPSVPVAQPRPRAVKFGNSARVHEVTHIKTSTGRKQHPIVMFRSTVQMVAAEAFSDSPLEGPLDVSLVFVMPRRNGLIWKTKPMPRLPHTKKPDCDNLVKSVFDALNQIVWKDDSQVIRLQVEKWIAAGNEQPHVEVEIKPSVEV